jgi:hypothetical protein
MLLAQDLPASLKNLGQPLNLDEAVKRPKKSKASRTRSDHRVRIMNAQCIYCKTTLHVHPSRLAKFKYCCEAHR